MICKCPDGVAASGYNLHSHLYMAQCKKCLPDLLDLDAHMLALPVNNVCMDFTSVFQIQNCPLFLIQTYVRADL